MAEHLALRKDGEMEAQSTAPSINRTPVGPASPPLPYAVSSKLDTATGCPDDVRLNGFFVYILNRSSEPKCEGDDQGTDKGVKSGTMNGETKPLEGSSNLRAHGQPVVREGDKCSMNSENTVGVFVAKAAEAPPPRPGEPDPESDPPLEPQPEELTPHEPPNQPAQLTPMVDPPQASPISAPPPPAAMQPQANTPSPSPAKPVEKTLPRTSKVGFKLLSIGFIPLLVPPLLGTLNRKRWPKQKPNGEGQKSWWGKFWDFVDPPAPEEVLAPEKAENGSLAKKKEMKFPQMKGSGGGQVPPKKVCRGNIDNEHIKLLGNNPNGRIWIADKPYPGVDEDTYVADPRGNYKGQCVSLGKSRCRDLPPTEYYRLGAKVQGNTKIPNGTLCAATSNGENWKKGGHLVIYNGQSQENGLLVTDQYTSRSGQPVKQHYIPWEGRGKDPSFQSQGQCYRVLVTIP